jgi:LCCL domain
MSPAISIARPAAWAALLLTLALAAPLRGKDPERADKPPDQPAGEAPKAAALQVRFTDDSVLKLSLRDEKIELATPYGKLLIPVADVRGIDFGTHIPDDVSRRIDAAIADLGSSEFAKREAATAELLKLREKAYPALLEAAKSSDAEAKRRAEGVLEQLKAAVPADQLTFRPFDIVYTDHSQIAGHLGQAALKAQTAQFGEVELKLADLRTLQPVGPGPRVVNVLPDPGSLTDYQGRVGESFYFRVTGANSGSLWGTDLYTTDSTLAMAAVHAGVLAVGQTGLVKVTILPGQQAYQGTQRNGVVSSPWPAYPASFQVSRPDDGVDAQDGTGRPRGFGRRGRNPFGGLRGFAPDQ